LIIPPPTTTKKQKIEKDKIAIATDGIPSAVYLFEVRQSSYDTLRIGLEFCGGRYGALSIKRRKFLNGKRPFLP